MTGIETFDAFDAELEIRASGGRRSLRGRFSYSRGPGRGMATIRDRGRVRKERVAGDAFGWQMREFVKLQKQMAEMIEGAVDQARLEIFRQELERRNVHVLAGHDYNRPLGDLKSGTAKIYVDARGGRIRSRPAGRGRPTELHARYGGNGARRTGGRGVAGLPGPARVGGAGRRDV